MILLNYFSSETILNFLWRKGIKKPKGIEEILREIFRIKLNTTKSTEEKLVIHDIRKNYVGELWVIIEWLVIRRRFGSIAGKNHRSSWFGCHLWSSTSWSYSKMDHPSCGTCATLRWFGRCRDASLWSTASSGSPLTSSAKWARRRLTSTTLTRVIYPYNYPFLTFSIFSSQVWCRLL